LAGRRTSILFNLINNTGIHPVVIIIAGFVANKELETGPEGIGALYFYGPVPDDY
jgi:hypothetical protein